MLQPVQVVVDVQVVHPAKVTWHNWQVLLFGPLLARAYPVPHELQYEVLVQVRQFDKD